MGDIIRAGNKQLLMKSKASGREVPQARLDEFLVRLAESCNMSRAARQAGVAHSTIYRLRARDPDFAAAWQQAIEAGYERLELALVEAALARVTRRAEMGVPWQGAADADAAGTGAAEAGAAEADDSDADHADKDDDAGAAAPLGEPLVEPMTMEQAIALLGRYRATVRSGKFQTPRPRAALVPTPEETDAAILSRLAVLRRQRGWDAL